MRLRSNPIVSDSIEANPIMPPSTVDIAEIHSQLDATLASPEMSRDKAEFLKKLLAMYNLDPLTV